MKLQQAYLSESAKIGDWSLIGYKAPGTVPNTSGASKAATSETTNFTYTDAFDKGATADLSSGKTNAWTAANRVKLNDCAISSAWTISIAAAESGSEGDAKFTAALPTGGSCDDLTPSFALIGK